MHGYLHFIPTLVAKQRTFFFFVYLSKGLWNVCDMYHVQSIYLQKRVEIHENTCPLSPFPYSLTEIMHTHRSKIINSIRKKTSNTARTNTACQPVLANYLTLFPQANK
jgi:hypothetical protein